MGDPISGPDLTAAPRLKEDKLMAAMHHSGVCIFLMIASGYFGDKLKHVLRVRDIDVRNREFSFFGPLYLQYMIL